MEDAIIVLALLLLISVVSILVIFRAVSNRRLHQSQATPVDTVLPLAIATTQNLELVLPSPKVLVPQEIAPPTISEEVPLLVKSSSQMATGAPAPWIESVIVDVEPPQPEVTAPPADMPSDSETTPPLAEIPMLPVPVNTQHEVMLPPVRALELQVDLVPPVIEDALSVRVEPPLGENVILPGEEISSQTELQKKRVAPEDRGGHPHGLTRSEKRSLAETKPRRPKPEIVCWKHRQRWIIGVEVPEEYQDCVGLAATQENDTLAQYDERRWVLARIDEPVCVTWDEAEQSMKISVGKTETPYLLFRLIGQNVNRGRLVRYATAGTFLVIAPDQWQRDEQISGPASISSEHVSIEGYRAHYFLVGRENASRIGFCTPQGQQAIIPTRSSKFQLIGNILPDARDDVGPLFGERPPLVRAVDQRIWQDIRIVVVGQEGHEQGRWRKTLSPPQLGCAEQELPAEILEQGCGWYFIRFYDTKDDLVESLDFRFIDAVKEIRFSPYSALPSIDGHCPVRVEFLHDVGCLIESTSSPTEYVPTEQDDTRTSIRISPDVLWDETRWMVHSKSRIKVEVKVLVERVWWAIEKESSEEGQIEWTDRPFQLERDFFAATSKHSILFRLPRRRWADEIYVGFQRWKANGFRVDVAEREVRVPLSHFEGKEEIEDQKHEHFLKLWIKSGANQDMSAVVAVIPASRPSVPAEVSTSKNVNQPLRTRRLRAKMRRVRKYLGHLEQITQDAVLHEMIRGARAQWLVLDTEVKPSSRSIETACLISLAWKIIRANGFKIPRRRKRWLKKLVGLAAVHPEVAQEVREQYEALTFRTSVPAQPMQSGD